MDEDIAAKVAAPVTRMRRRLSGHSDIVNSPSTPSTPTKTRSGRRLSQLDQIDENAPVSRSRKTTKLQIITDTTQTVQSPRAQRAARRNSHVDSESEAPVTPVRQTRRTRKDSTSSTENLKPLTPARVTRKTRRTSTSSADNQVENVSINKPTIQEPIPEEQESNLQQNSLEKSKNDNNSPNNIRKSPRLMAKKDKNGTTDDTDFNHETDSPEMKVKKLESNTAVIVTKLNLEEITKSSILMNSSPTQSSTDKSDNMNNSKDLNGGLSEASFDLIKHLDAVSKKIKSNLNRSTTALHNKKSTGERHRTKSWTPYSTVVSNNDSNFHSDTEYIKKRNKNHEKSNIKISITEPSPGKALNSVTMQGEKDTIETMNLNKITNMTPERPEVIIQNNKENYNEDHESNTKYQITPSKNVESIVYIEDTDANTGINNEFINRITNNEDQCVPVVKYQFEEQNKSSAQPDANISKQNEANNSITNSVSLNSYNIGKKDDSCEPMDVDVTIPERVGIEYPTENKFIDDTNKSMEINTREQEKLSLTNGKESDEGNDNSNKLKRSSMRHSMLCDADEINGENEKTSTKNQPMMNISMDLENSLKSNKSSSLHSLSQQLNKSGIHSKSTLVLSQIKDISESYNIPNAANITNDNVEKPINNSNISKNDKNSKSNISNNDFDDTPMKQKDIHKLGMQTSTPVIDGKGNIKKETVKTKTPKKEISAGSKTRESVLESAEESEEQNNFIDDKAEDTGDDYESGDSQGEDEIENAKYEILEKGETLTSEDEISNDTDYEKDSFIVSSDENDDELLSGTGDDLSMSDKELTMSAKSKQKYNERKTKEQKKASREMYESRHKVKSSGNSKKKDYLSSSEDDDYSLKANKKHRLRLESYTSKSDIDESISKIKKNTKRSELMEINDEMNENKLTACINISEDNIIVKPQNKSRLRLDSVTDSSMMKSDVDKSVSKKKKQKNKRLSESYIESAVNEKEITAVNNESIFNKTDPLSPVIKVEQCTPQKDNTLNFTHRKEIEQIQVENYISVTNHNESVDPLQATVADDDNSSISENEQIKQNYDSILRDLNKEIKGIKSHDISLNLNKEKKIKNKNSLMDQLNLTQTKQSINKSQKRKNKEANENTIKNAENESSSDAIDLNLIFPQDSNDDEEQEKNEGYEENEVLIPLKRTEGKTSISDKDEHDESLNKSKKKKNKKRKSSDTGKESEEKETIFFIDTKGRKSHSDTSTNVLVHTSLASKHLSIDENADTIKEIYNNEHNNDGPLNDSIKKKNKKRKSSLKSSDTGEENVETIFFIDTKGRKAGSDTSTNVLLNTSSTIKNMSIDETPDTIKEIDNNERDDDESLNECMKKKNKKRKSSLKSPDTGKENDKEETSFFIDTKGRRSDSDTSTNVLVHTSLTSKHLSIDENPDTIKEIDLRMDEKAEIVKSKKRKRNSPIVDTGDEIVEGIDDQNKEESFVNKSHKKKRKSSHHDENIDIQNEEVIIKEQDIISKPKQAGFEKKKNKKNIVIQAYAREQPSVNKKKGNNSTDNRENVHASGIDDHSKEESFAKKSQKKKPKNSHHDENIDIQNEEVIIKEQDISKPEQAGFEKKKKKKNIVIQAYAQEQPIVNKKKGNNSTENKGNVHASDVEIINKENVTRNAEETSFNKKKKKNVENQENVLATEQNSNAIPPTKFKHGIQNKQKDTEISKKKKHSPGKAPRHAGNPAGDDNKMTQKSNKKRKERDDDDSDFKNTKVLKENFFDCIHVPRLPADILKQLDDRSTPKSVAISTTEFVVEETKRRNNKPSNYLEETINLNANSPLIKKNKTRPKKPNVLPFIPTACISGDGCTTKFVINVTPQEAKFTTQSSNASNFKNDYLYRNKIKRLGTYELYKKHRTIKLSKF